MKKIKGIIYVLFCIICFQAISNTLPLSATSTTAVVEETTHIQEETEENCNSMICESEESTSIQVEIQQEELPENTTIGLSWWVQPLLSRYKDVYEEHEKNQWYIKYFDGTAILVPIYNTTWFGDAKGVIITVVYIIVFLINFIGILPAYLLMILVNLTSGGLIKEVVLGISEWANTTIFGWDSQTNNFGIKLIVILGVIAIAKNVLQNYKDLEPKKLFRLIGATVFAGLVIAMIAPNAVKITESIDTQVTSFLSLAAFAEEDSGLPEEVQAKKDMYDLLILQPYLMQHFNSGTIEAVQVKLDAAGIELDATTLVEASLSCTSEKDQNACLEKVYPDIKGKGLFGVIHSEFPITQWTSVTKALLLALHRWALSIPFMGLYTIKGMFELIRWLSVVFSIFALFSLMFGDKNYLKFFQSRLMWAFTAWGFSIMISLVIRVIMQLINGIVSKTDTSMILAFDIVLIALLWVIWKFRKMLARMLLRTVMTGASLIRSSTTRSGYSPRDAMNDIRMDMLEDRVYGGDDDDDHDDNDDDHNSKNNGKNNSNGDSGEDGSAKRTGTLGGGATAEGDDPDNEDDTEVENNADISEGDEVKTEATHSGQKKSSITDESEKDESQKKSKQQRKNQMGANTEAGDESEEPLEPLSKKNRIYKGKRRQTQPTETGDTVENDTSESKKQNSQEEHTSNTSKKGTSGSIATGDAPTVNVTRRRKKKEASDGEAND